MPGKARARRPGPAAAPKATARKRPGGTDAEPDGTLFAQAAPPAEAMVPAEENWTVAREQPDCADPVPDRVSSAEAAQPAAATAPGKGGTAVGRWPGDEDSPPRWAVPMQAGQAAAPERSGGEDELPDWAGPDWEVPDGALVPDETDTAAAGLWPGADEAARGRATAREWFGGEEAARAACLKLLTTAPRTRAQLAAALRRRRVPEEIAESVLARFTEVGLIDDAAFARAWVESRHHSRGLARRALAAELRQRGVADGEVRAAVGSLGTQDEVAAAKRLVAKRIAATRGRPIPVRVRQLLAMLARRGYSAGLAARVVREALEQEREALEPDEPGSPEDRLDLARFCEDSAAGDWL